MAYTHWPSTFHLQLYRVPKYAIALPKVNDLNNLGLHTYYICFLVVVRQFQEYADPEEAGEDKRRSGIKDEDKVLLPLDENVLTDNLGLQMVIVVSKVTIIYTLAVPHNGGREGAD